METGSASVVLNADLGAVVAGQSVERLPLGTTQVGRRNDAERDSSLTCIPQLRLQNPDSGPHDERAQQINLVTGGKLGAQLGTHARLAGGVGEEGGVRQGCRRAASSVDSCYARARRGGEAEQLLDAADRGLAGLLKEVKDLFNECHAVFGTAAGTKAPEDGFRDVSG